MILQFIIGPTSHVLCIKADAVPRVGEVINLSYILYEVTEVQWRKSERFVGTKEDEEYLQPVITLKEYQR